MGSQRQSSSAKTSARPRESLGQVVPGDNFVKGLVPKQHADLWDSGGGKNGGQHALGRRGLHVHELGFGLRMRN